MFASRLGSLSTVFTWLRSRACAGMQGLGVLALVVVAPCGFAAPVASEEAVLSSPRNRCGNGICTNVKNTTQVAKFAPSLAPVPLPPTPPEPKPLDPSPRPLVPSPTPQGILQKTRFFLFLYRIRNVKNTTQVAKFAPSLGPVPLSPWRPPEHRAPLATLSNQAPTLPLLAPALVYPPVHQASSGALPPTPPEPKPLDPPPRALVPSPTLQGILKAPFFFFLYVRNVKNTTQVAKFAPSLGPVPLPPTPPEPKPLDPPPRALVPSPTPQGILQNTPFFFFLYALETSKIRRKLRNLLRPWGPCPYHLRTLPHPTGNPSKNACSTPLSRPNNIGHPLPLFRAPALVYPLSTKPALGPCPYHLPPQNRSPWTPLPEPLSLPLKNTTQVAKFALSLGLVPLPPTPPEPKPLDPSPRPLVPSPTPQGILQNTPFSSKIRRKLRNLLRSWGPCPYHLPPRNQSPWTPLRDPLYPPPPHTGNPSKNAIFLLFVRIRNVKNTTQVAKFAPSLGPVPLPPTPPAPKPLETPRAPDLGPRGIGHPLPLFRTKPQPSLLAPALVYPPVHQASSGAVPLPPTPPEPKPLDPPPRALCLPPPYRASFKVRVRNVKIRHKLRNLLRPWGPCPYHLPPRNQSPWTPLPEPLYPPPPHRASFKTRHFSSFCMRWKRQKYDASCEICSVPGTRAPTIYPPKPLDPSPRPFVPSPTPQGILQKTRFFFFLYTLETSKIRRKLRNLLRPWGPCPYHLPPRHRSPWRPPEPQTWGLGASGTLCHSFEPSPFLHLPWSTPLSTKPALGPCPYHLPPQNRSPWTPLPEPLCLPPPYRASFKKRNFSSFCTCLCVLNVKNTTQVAKFAPSLGPVPLPPTPRNQSPWTPLRAPLYPPPPHRESFKKRDFSSFCYASCEICSVPGARAPTTYPPGTEALGDPPSPRPGPRGIGHPLPPSCTCPGLPPCPPGQLWGRAPTTYPPRTEALGPPSPSPCAFPHPTGHPSKNAILKIRHKLRNLLRPWGPCPYHLPPRNQSPWTPLPKPLYPPPPHRASFKTRHFSSFCTR